jgi:hypothetical protein
MLSEKEKEDLDTKWIEDFELIDNSYKTFYADDITHIKFHYIYVNRENNIDKVKEETILLKTPNYVSKEELIGLLKKHNKSANISYTVLSILKYNIDVYPSDVSYYLKKKNITEDDPHYFLKSVKNIDSIPLDKTISMFQDLNDIIIVFYEKTTNNKNNSNQCHNYTKKIILKTIKTCKNRTYRKIV